MPPPRVSAEYLSTGANRHAAVADWSSSGIHAFGAHVNIALWRPSSAVPKGIFALLSGHKDAVKAVRFLPPGRESEPTFLVSGSDDRSLKLWSLGEEEGKYECVQTVEWHTGAVNCITALGARASDGTVLGASGAADGTVHVWRFEPQEPQLHLLQTIKLKPKYFPLALALSPLAENGDVIALAAAGTRDTIQIFLADRPDSSLEFKLQATLSGHEGWIRSLDFVFENGDAGGDLLLASASQDKYIRLWRVHAGKELPALTAAAASDPSSGAFLPGKSPSNKAHRLSSGGRDFSITFEALLLGHEDWIYTAKWHHTQLDEKLQLLSTSADNSLTIWEADPASGIWVSMARLGEISREKGATTATGSIGGFWTGAWAPDGQSIVCLGRTGSWRRWVYDKARAQWVPGLATTGHTRAVTGIAWSKTGEYLVSTSSDQTTRLHARWKQTGTGADTWHEMARPQIHGYDLNCVDTLGGSQFVSGADEKLMRVFSEPGAVAKLLSRLSGIARPADLVGSQVPDAADMPVLGLSNKAIDSADPTAAAENQSGESDAPDMLQAIRKSALEIDHPPFEDGLSRHTLWPETEKLYGHGYELSCLAASHDGRLVASACRASSLNHAVVRLFETERWTEVRPPLTAHTLTVTRLRFSLCDRYLLSVGRDRQWAVFEKGKGEAEGGGGDGRGGEYGYGLLQANPKGHSRMILDAAWAPGEAQLVFATAGRDKTAKVWVASRGGSEEDKPTFKLATTIPADHPVTAVDFLSITASGHLVLAVGTEAGKLSIYSLDPETMSLASTLTIQPDLCLPRAVLQLAWQPLSKDGEEVVGAKEHHRLAVAGEDSSLRILAVEGL